jgi:hypothetical protein
VKKYVEDDTDDAIESKIKATNEVQEQVKVYRIPNQLESSFNPDASMIVERIEQGRDI